jgi:hypothetical protein
VGKKRKPVEITAYTHPPLVSSEQEPDTQPGPYYVSVKDGSRAAFLSGPYETHEEALALVDRARAICNEHDYRSAFYSFGTCRMKDGSRPPAYLQSLGYDLALTNKKEARNSA